MSPDQTGTSLIWVHIVCNREQKREQAIKVVNSILHYHVKKN